MNINKYEDIIEVIYWNVKNRIYYRNKFQDTLRDKIDPNNWSTSSFFNKTIINSRVYNSGLLAVVRKRLFRYDIS